jgi:hypothetical protein
VLSASAGQLTAALAESCGEMPVVLLIVLEVTMGRIASPVAAAGTFSEASGAAGIGALSARCWKAWLSKYSLPSATSRSVEGCFMFCSLFYHGLELSHRCALKKSGKSVFSLAMPTNRAAVVDEWWLVL